MPDEMTSPDGAWVWDGSQWVPNPNRPMAPPVGMPAAQSTNGMAIASLVLGILWIGWIGSILALIFGYVAKRQIRERGDSGGGMATAGIVLGWVGVGFLALYIFIVIIAVATTSSTGY